MWRVTLRRDAAAGRMFVRRPPAGRRSDCGLASVEMVLLIPFMLILILLLANIGKFWHAKLDNRIAARTSAWRGAEFNSFDLRLTGAFDCVLDSDQLETANKVTGLVDALERRCNEASANVALLTTMNSGTGGDTGRKKAFVGILQAPKNQPGATTGEAFRTWSTWGFEDQSVFWLNDSHTLDIAGKTETITDPWLREALPFGYDAYLDKELLGGKSNYTSPEIQCRQEQEAQAKVNQDYNERCEALRQSLNTERAKDGDPPLTDEQLKDECDQEIGERPAPPPKCEGDA